MYLVEIYNEVRLACHYNDMSNIKSPISLGFPLKLSER